MIDKTPILNIPPKVFGDKHFASEFNRFRRFLLDLADDANARAAGYKGYLKLSDAEPTQSGLYRLMEIGTYANLTPAVDFNGDPTTIVTEDGFINEAYFDGTKWLQNSIELNTEQNIFTFSDFQNALHVPGNVSNITVSIGNTIILDWVAATPDIATIKIPIKNGDKAFVFTKQGAFSPCFITNYSNVVTQVFGTTPGNYLTTPLDITSTTDGYLYINAHEFVTAERDLIRVYTGDAYSLEKISRNNNTETYTTVKKTVKKNGTIGVDCDYTDIRDALSAITDNSAKKRYILYVMDGDYDYSNNGDVIGVRLKNYVTLRGQSYNTRIIKRDSAFDWAKAAVDKASGDMDYLAIDGFFTIISNNCKCPLHIDSGLVKYAIFQNINLINEQALGTEDNPVDGEANCFALGWNGSDHIVLKNIKANGKLWGHNSTDTQSKGIFEFINCDCRVIQIGDLTSQGQDSIIVKGCNADEFQLLWFSEFTSASPKRNSFDFTFEGNNIKNAIIKDHAGTHDALEEFYKGKFPFAIAGIHKEYYGTGITKGSDVSKVNNSTVKTWQSGETVFGKALENTDANGRLLIQLK